MSTPTSRRRRRRYSSVSTRHTPSSRTQLDLLALADGQARFVAGELHRLVEVRLDDDELRLELAGAVALPAIAQAVGGDGGAEALRDEAQHHVPALALDGAHERAQRLVGRALRIDVERIAREAPAVGLLHERQPFAVGELDLGAQLDAAVREAAGGALIGGAEAAREGVAIVRLAVVGRHERVGGVGAAGAHGVGERAQGVGGPGSRVRRASDGSDERRRAPTSARASTIADQLGRCAMRSSSA